MLFGDQRAKIQRPSAAVVDHIGRVAADKAGAQLFANTLNRFHTHVAAGVDFGKEIGGILNVIMAETAGEEDAFTLRCFRHPQRVDGIGGDFKRQIGFGGWRGWRR